MHSVNACHKLKGNRFWTDPEEEALGQGSNNVIILKQQTNTPANKKKGRPSLPGNFIGCCKFTNVPIYHSLIFEVSSTGCHLDWS